MCFVRHLFHEGTLEWLVWTWTAAGETDAAAVCRQVLSSPLVASAVLNANDDTATSIKLLLRRHFLLHLRAQALSEANLL